MKKRRKRWWVLLAAGLVIWRIWPVVMMFFPVHLLNLSSDFQEIPGVLPPPSEPTSAHEGMPDPLSPRGLPRAEVLFKPRKTFHGHIFRPEKQRGERIRNIGKVLSERRSYEPWSGHKMCGGFHADYYLAWDVNSKKWEAMVCMGCREAILYHAGKSLRCDLSRDAVTRIQTAEAAPRN